MYFKSLYFDMLQSAKLKHIWTTLAISEIKSSYKKTKLGPLWITLSTTILLFSMGPLYSTIFKSDFKTYFVYLGCGFIFWAFIKDTILESANEYINSQGYILSQPYPLSIYIFKCILKNIITFFHNFIVIIFIVIFYSDNLTFLNLLIFGFGFFINILILFFIGLSVSVVCLRFRDILNIIQNIFTVLFFLTPILWMPSLLENKTYFIYGNIFFSMIDIMRSPLIGNGLPRLSFIICIFFLLLSILLSAYLFGKYKNKIALWS